MINACAFLALPQTFGNICKVYSPLVKDVAENPKFPLFRKLLTTSFEEIEDQYNEKNLDAANAPDPFDYLIQVGSQGEQYASLIKEAIEFFIKEEVTILFEEKIIFIGNLEEEVKKVKDIHQLRMINKENFFDFQNTIRLAFGDDIIKPPDPNMDPRKKRMLALARYRDKIKAKKTDGIDFSTTLAAICCMGIGLTPLNIGEISIGALYTLMPVYQNKERYELDIQSLLAGADKKKVKPKYWIRNLDEK